MNKFEATEFIQPFPTSLEVKGNKELAQDSIAYETGLIEIVVLNTHGLGLPLNSIRTWIGPKETDNV